MFLKLNIDVWKDNNSEDLYIKGAPSGVDTTLIKAGTPISHKEDGMLARRIKDEKIIFGPSCLPTIDRLGEAWKWEGFSSRGKLKRNA